MFDLLKRIKFRWFWILFAQIVILVAYVIARELFSEQVPFFASEDMLYLVLAGVFLFFLISILVTLVSFDRSTRQNYVTITNTLGADISEVYSFGEIALVLYNENKEIIWSSNLFTERGINVLGQIAYQRFANLKPFFLQEGNEVKDKVLEETINQRTYKVMNLPDMNILIFKDITTEKEILTSKEKEAAVLMIIQLDNLFDVANTSADDEFVQMEALIRRAIADWAKDNSIVIKKVKEDTYFGILSEESYKLISEGGFKILSDVKRISANNDITFTISLGFGRGMANYVKLSELASAAIEIAQSRGGDQAVVNNFGGKMEFVGGLGSEAKIKRNQSRVRTFAQSFCSYIENFETVFVLVHLQADFDAIGAALGVVSIARSLNRQVYIVYEDKQIETKAKNMLKETFSRSEIDSFSLTPAKAIEKVDDKCLVVVVDVNRPSLTTSPRLLEKAANVGVIDHHRRAEDAIDNPLYSYVDTMASSASELITEIIMNAKKSVKVSPNVATYLLAGILLDTGGFKTRTSAATFEAAMHLKELGADNSIADNYLKDEYEEFLLKTKIMSNIESPYFGIVIATAPSSQIVDQTLLARVGDELVGVKGVRAAFVVGNIGGQRVGISARSDGNVNVQFIMEKMEGGGHHSAAATQISNEKIDAVLERLKKVLNLYINEITGKEDSYGSNIAARR